MNLDFERKEEINYSIIIPHKKFHCFIGTLSEKYSLSERCSGNSGR